MAIWRDIIFLYEKTDDPEVSKQVDEARKLLAKRAPKSE
jgi:hypothetical protein